MSDRCGACNAGMPMGAAITPDGGRYCPHCGSPVADNPRTIHTIPVPRGWSVEQAWEAISRDDCLSDPCPSWANVEVVDGVMVRVLADGEDE